MPALPDLRTQQRRSGILFTLVSASVGITLALTIAADDLAAPGSIWRTPVVIIPLLSVVLTARWRRFGTVPRKERFREFLLEPGRFIVPCISTRSRNVLIAQTINFIVFGILMSRLLGASNAIVCFGLATLPAGILLLTRLRFGPRAITLTADGISVVTGARIRRSSWDDISGASVRGRQLVIERLGKGNLRIFSELVDAHWIANAILFYLRVPVARAHIGTEAELAQLQAGIAAAAAAGLTPAPWTTPFFRVS